jgi:hypothetical protein
MPCTKRAAQSARRKKLVRSKTKVTSVAFSRLGTTFLSASGKVGISTVPKPGNRTVVHVVAAGDVAERVAPVFKMRHLAISLPSPASGLAPEHDVWPCSSQGLVNIAQVPDYPKITPGGTPVSGTINGTGEAFFPRFGFVPGAFGELGGGLRVCRLSVLRKT